MRLRIDIHRLGAKLGIQRFNFRELVGRILVEDMELALARCDKQQP